MYFIISLYTQSEENTEPKRYCRQIIKGVEELTAKIEKFEEEGYIVEVDYISFEDLKQELKKHFPGLDEA